MSGRQGQVINILTVVAAIFLPLTFITGYFGMNFDVLTMDLNTVGWFVGLGVLLPAASLVVTLVLFRNLIARMGVQPFLETVLARRPPPPEPAQPPQ